MNTELRYHLGLLAVVALWLGLRVLFFNGYYVEDAPGYVTDAAWAATGQYHARHDVNGLNVGTYLPVAPWLWLFGKTEAALAVWPLACSLLGLLSVASLCRRLFGPWEGLLAAFCYATYPGDVFFSTVVMPDAIQAGWLSFSMLLVVLASERREASTLLIGAGVALGVSHLARANDVLLLPVGVMAAAILAGFETRRAAAVRRAALYVTGWLLVVAAEGASYLWAAGDFWLRVSTVNAHYGTAGSIQRAGLNIDSTTIPFSLFAPLLWWSRGGWWHFNQDQAYHGFLFCLAVLSLLVAAGVLWHKPRRPGEVRVLCVAATWLLWPLFYQQFGTQSLTEFVPIHRLSRHLVVYAPGAIVSVACGWGCVRRYLATRARAPGGAMSGRALAGAFLITFSVFNWRAEAVTSAAFHQIKGTYLRIHDHLPPGSRTLVGDPGDLCFFDFWLNPLGRTQVRVVPFAALNDCHDIERGAVVLTWSNQGWHDNAEGIVQAVSRLPCLTQPPVNWTLVYGGYSERVFHVE